jgi:uncharacterized protein (DUF58 family)
MAGAALNEPLAGLAEADLERLARVAERWLGGRATVSGGQRAARRPGSGSEFLDYRRYVAGDDLRRLDWRVSLRCRQPQVRRYQDEAASDWYLCLDRSASMRLPDPTKWGLAVQVAAAWAYLLLHLDCRVGLLLFSGVVDGGCSLGRGPQQYGRLLHCLRAAVPVASGGGSRPASCAERLAARSGVLLISDFLAEDGMRADLARLRGHGVQALQVLSSRELVLPEAARLTLCDVESGARLSVAPTPEQRLQAAATLQRWQTALADDCRRQGIPFTAASADTPWQTVVLAHLRRLQPGHA